MNSRAIASILSFIFLTFFNGLFAKNNENPQASNSIIFIIHEDASYDYFDGNLRKNAAHETVKKAKKVAESLTNGEVFIFRQKPLEKNCFCFSKKSHTAYFYSKGQLVSKSKSYRDEHPVDFELEFDFFKLHSPAIEGNSKNHTHVLYYFGAKIPEIEIPGYSFSMGKEIFYTNEYFDGLKRFTDALGKKFDALIQASSYGGTPGMVARSLELGDYYVSSPSPLSHVSYDIEKLSLLNHKAKEQLPILLKNFIDSSFSVLKTKSVEEVSISFYDGPKVQSCIGPIYERYLELLSEFNSRTYALGTFVDCMDHAYFSDAEYQELFASEAMQQGIYTLFRAAYKGWGVQKKKNSGWVCPIPPKE